MLAGIVFIAVLVLLNGLEFIVGFFDVILHVRRSKNGGRGLIVLFIMFIVLSVALQIYLR